MTTLKTVSLKASSHVERILVVSIFAVATMLMFGLAYTAQAATLDRQLELGMSGPDVSTLQTFLATDNTIYPQGLVTGYFGSLTKSAVSNFQARNGISNIGRVGPVTLAAINAQMNNGMTIGTDKTAPVISGLNLSITNSGVTMNWGTDKNAAAVIYYSNTPLTLTEGSPTSPIAIGGSSLLVNSNLQISHTGTITGLNPNTIYYYVVYVRDGNGNENITWPSTFKTAQ
jgi:hypothetical protein